MNYVFVKYWQRLYVSRQEIISFFLQGELDFVRHLLYNEAIKWSVFKTSSDLKPDPSCHQEKQLHTRAV